MPVRALFSKSTIFKICRQKMCRFRVNGRPIRHIIHRFQNVPASCERSLSLAFEWNFMVLFEAFSEMLLKCILSIRYFKSATLILIR